MFVLSYLNLIFTMQNLTSPQFIFQSLKAPPKIYLARYLTAIECMHCSFIERCLFCPILKNDDRSEILQQIIINAFNTGTFKLFR